MVNEGAYIGCGLVEELARPMGERQVSGLLQAEGLCSSDSRSEDGNVGSGRAGFSSGEGVVLASELQQVHGKGVNPHAPERIGPANTTTFRPISQAAYRSPLQIFISLKYET